MKIAICSDIHSNKPALNAVVTDMEQRNIDVKICLGDIIGYNLWPRDCLEIVNEKFDIIVQGNHDRNVKNPARYKSNPMAYHGLKHSKEQLSQSQTQWLSNLPLQKRYSTQNKSLLFTHEHPDTSKIGTREAYVFPRHFSKIIPYLSEKNVDGIFLGHTHIRHTREVNNGLLHNPGSVGQPRDGTKGAVYTIYKTDSNTITNQTVQYDIESVVQKVKQSNLPDKTGLRLLNGE